MFKISCKFQKWNKKFRKMFCFLDNCIWIESRKFPQLWQGYMSLAVYVVTNTPNIANITKRDIFQISFPQCDEKLWSKCFHADFTDVCNPLTSWLLKGVLKRSFLDICLTMSVPLLNSSNKLLATIIFFFKMSKNWCKFQICIEKMRKRFSFFRQLHSNWERQILTIPKRILPIGSQCVIKYP